MVGNERKYITCRHFFVKINLENLKSKASNLWDKLQKSEVVHYPKGPRCALRKILTLQSYCGNGMFRPSILQEIEIG